MEPVAHRPLSIAMLAAGLALAVAAPAPARAGARKAAGCPGGRFVVTQGHELLGGPEPPAILVVDGAALAVEGACPSHGTAKARRKGSVLAAAWDACGPAKKLRLRATARDCSAVRGKLRARKQRAALVAMPSVCGDGVVDRGAGEQCDGAHGCAGGAPCTACRCDVRPPLDCELAGYPCRFADVPLEVVARSLALGDEAVARMEAGTSVEQVGAFLQSQADMADVTVDGPVIGFRLTGGRPMIVDFAGVQRLLPVEAIPAAAVSAATPVAANVVVGDGLVKRGLVLSPFRYEFDDIGEQVASALGTVRGYEGSVTYLATVDELAPQVTVDTLTQLEGYDVVHIDTHGGTLCKTKEPAALVRSATGDGKRPCDDGVTDFLVQRFHGTAADLQSIAHPGVVHYRGRLHQSIAVTPDFFRHYYPQGLTNAVFVLGSCHTFRSDMASAIAGNDGIYVSWDRYTDPALLRTAGLALLDALGLGLTVDAAFARLPPLVPGNPGAEGSRLLHTQRRAGGDLRIRELPRLIHPSTGETLRSGDTLPIEGTTGDGQPDRLPLVLEVEGAAASEGDAFQVQIAVDGVAAASGTLAELATPEDELRWRGETTLELGFDVPEGGTVELLVTVLLPEGGTSVFEASPRLTGTGFAPGKLWQGTFTRTWSTGLTNRTLVVSATFERDPDESPTTRYPTFLLKSGTMTWSLADVGGDPCTYSAPQTVTPLGPSDSDLLTFDLGEQPIEYYGAGHSDGPVVDLEIACTGPGSTTSATEAGGQWWKAPLDEHFTVLGDGTIAGSYVSGNDVYEWAIARIE